MAQAEVDELCAALSAKTRSLEQREMSQMRQNAILQRKVEAAEQSSRDLKQRQAQAREVAQRQRRESLTATRGSKVDTSASEEAARALEADLQRRMEETARRLEALERDAQAARSRRRQLEADLSFNRRCARELAAALGASGDAAATAQTAEGAGVAAADVGEDAAKEAEERAKQLQARAGQLAAQSEALRESCDAMRERLVEVERMAVASQLQEEQLRSRNEGLAAAGATAERRFAEALARRTEEHRRVEAFRERLEQAEDELARHRAAATSSTALAAAASSAASTAAAAAGEADPEAGRGGGRGADRREEMSYLQRKVEEREQALTNLRSEGARLQAALRRHAGLEGSHRHTDQAAGEGLCAALDESVFWLVMLLFKSILVRRFFCVHLGIIYAWVFFLLWWMSHP